MDILKIYDEQSSKWQELPALKGSNGLYVGNVEPTDPDIHVWIDTTSSGIRLVDYIYPVGSIYISVNNTSPSTLFGGTWEQIQDTFLLAAGNTYTAGETGGEAEHMLTVDEMPSHIHGTYYRGTYATGSGAWGIDPGTLGTAYSGDNVIQPTGGGQAHNNMPPYLTVYMWKRVS